MTRILVADDNAQNLYLLDTILKSSGYDVITARDGKEALASALENPPDMIVTDILMPNMDGFELCRKFKSNEILQNIPFIFYTATYTDLKDEQFALSLGADRFVIKPQQPEILLQIIQETLSKSGHANVISRRPLGDEAEILREYNAVLFHKLEQKVLQLEEQIEKQKKVECMLRESEVKYHTLVAQSQDGIFISNLQGTFLSVNNAMCEALQYSEQELLSMNIWDIIPDKYIDLHKKRIADILSGKSHNTTAEYAVMDKGGKLHYIEILSAPYYEGDELVGFQGIARDITDRRTADEALRLSEQKYRQLYESMMDAFAIVDMKGKITEFNEAFLKLIGYSSEEVCQLNKTDLTPEKWHIVEAEIIEKQVMIRGYSDVFEKEYRRKNGSVFPIELRINLVRDESGNPQGMWSVIRDITERREAEDKSKQYAMKLIREMEETIEAISSTVEVRDPYTSGHQRRVTKLSVAIASEMGLPEEIIRGIRLASLVHDIGKMYVPAEILSKPTKLDELEYALIKKHAQAGYDILKKVEFPWPIADIVHQHHERLDGSGYPQGLRGENILQEARILAVADVVEAMSTHRPYRPSLGKGVALEEILKNRGILYDKNVAEICARLFYEKGFDFE